MKARPEKENEGLLLDVRLPRLETTDSEQDFMLSADSAEHLLVVLSVLNYPSDSDDSVSLR